MSSQHQFSDKTTTQPPLAVVGISALFPKAANTQEFWSNIRRGVDAITEVPASHWNPEDYFDQNQKTPDMTYARRGGFLSPLPFDPLEFGISPNNLEAIDTSQLLGMVGAKRALEHAGYGAGQSFDRSRVGCILGVTGTLEMVIPLGARLGHPKWRKALKDAGVADDVADDVVNRISESYVPWQENSFPGLLGNVVAGRIANRLDLHGTNCVVDAACASSLSAIHLAALELWTGRSDMVVTGGIDTFNDIFMFMCFSKTPALSASGDSRPFSDEADGTILGEGVGMLVLKRQADAERDGDKIYAILKGIGTSSDGAGNAVYAPKAEGQIRCLNDAYRVAGVTPDTIELVEAHGTGTKVGDATEVTGLMEVYKSTGRRGAWCAVGSIKSQIGHTKAAAGAAGILKAILALQHRVLPPTIKVNRPPAALLADDSPFYVNTEARPWVKPNGYPRRAAVSAFGFGGSNFHCVLEESPQSIDQPDWDGDVQIVALSGMGQNDLIDNVRSKLAPLATSAWHDVRTFATHSRNQFRVEHPHRLLMVVERDKTDLGKLVAAVLTMFEKYPEKPTWSTPDGAHYGQGALNGKLGVLFPGQGAQYVGMLRELTCRFPVMLDVLDDANEVFANAMMSGRGASDSNRLSDYIYPHPSFSPETRAQHDTTLRATQIAQPAIGAISLAVLAVLDQFGVQPEAAAGHSYGELTALCASQRFAPRVLYRLSMLRGQLMAAAQDVEGGMLALGAPLTQVEAAIKELSVDLVVANHNSPTQVVLSGRLPEIDRATELFASRNIRGKKLAVAAAFHSPLVATASRAFRPVLDDVEFAPSRMPVYANSTAKEYPADPVAARDLLAIQLARPVNFVSEVERMYADGVRTFLEVGPSGVLTGLVNSILNGREYRAIAVDASGGKRGDMTDLANVFAQLSAAGHSVQLSQWDPSSGVTETAEDKRLRVPICGANYVKPRPPIPPRSAQKPRVVSESFTTTTDASLAMNAQQNQPEIVSSAQSMIAKPSMPKPVAPAPPTHLEDMRPMTTKTSVQPDSRPIVSAARTLNSDTVETIRQTLTALQRMQHETTRLHHQFLEGQEAAFKTFERLAERQLGIGQADTINEPVSRKTQLTALLATSESQASPVAEIAPAVTSVAVNQFQEVSRLEARPPAKEPHAVPASAPQTVMKAVVMPAPLPAPAPVNAPKVAIATQHQAPTPPISSVSAPPSHQKTLVQATQAKVVPISTSLGSTVLAVVSEKTGYPTEMLNLDMSLDHDLGIDSIKRVEILSALQERVPDLPAFQPDELGSLHTLQDVVSLADARTTTRPPASAQPVRPITQKPPAQSFVVPPVQASPGVEAPQFTGLGPVVLEVVSEKTGYPTEMLNLDMSLDHDLGIDSIKRVEILSALQERVPNLPSFQPEELGALHTLNDVVTLADARSAGVHDAARNVAVQNVSSAGIKSAPTIPAPSRNQNVSQLGPLVLQVVSEKTGYPTEMLNFDMSLDHDLGIDSIKRVEILSALQERVPNLPAFQPDELGALHTLKDVVTLADARSSGGTNNALSQTPVQQASTAVVPVTNHTLTSSQKSGELGAVVLDVVSEKTGYPTEMLNLDMSLDHDLGIDSIKRVEILSALQERVPELPAFQPEELGALHTLRDVVTLADARTTKTSSVSAALVSKSEFQTVKSAINPQSSRTLNTDSRINRSIVHCVPVAIAANRAKLRITPGSEIWVTDDGSDLSRQIVNVLTDRGFLARIVNLTNPLLPQESATLAGLIVVAAVQGMSEQQLWKSVEWLQKLGPTLRRNSQSMATLFATVSRLDGQFGFAANRLLEDPVSGGLAGLAKCAALEWPEVISRAFDISPDWTSNHVAAAMFVDELLHQGPVEVGITASGTTCLESIEVRLKGQHGSLPIAPGDVIVITGGARGVTAEAAFAIAKAWRPRLVILGRNPEPSPEPDWLSCLTTDAEIKQGLIARAPAGTTPKSISAQLDQITAGRDIARQLYRLYSLGISVSYHSVDVRDSAAVRALLVPIQREHGPVCGIIHGAGVLADQKIEDKTREQFERVYQTKISGLKSLLDSIEPTKLKVLGLFSSYTARFGRVGQMDYAIANEVLNKQARHFAIEYPQCRVASFNWGPWDGGMVQGGLKKLFAAEGVGLIPLDAGAEMLVQEFEQTQSRPVEVLVLASRQESGDAASLTHATNGKSGPASIQGKASAAMAPQVFIPVTDSSHELESVGDLKVAFERVLDVAQHSFLESHVIGGKAVLPVAMIMEWLSHGAIHRNPGLELRGFHDLRVYQGVRLGSHDQILLKVLAGKPVRNGDCFTARVQLVATNHGRDVLHAGGFVELAPAYSTVPQSSLHVSERRYSINLSAAYEACLFHGPMLQGMTAIEACSADGIVVTSRSAPSPWSWMSEPARGSWLADPLAIDSALQAIILWSQEFRGKPCLPCAIANYRQYRRTFPKDGIRIVIRMHETPDQVIRCDVEFIDLHGVLVARMEGCESVADVSLAAAFQRKKIEMSPV
jgi:acyl transferase domain-containing protein/NAD(P)-dependent dehydrogenase (short-subunit alcohol dehydrogenase family)